MLAKEQRIGALLLFGITLAGWLTVAILQSDSSDQPAPPVAPAPKPAKRTWEERKDSMRRVDSLRFVQWTQERQQRYDSFRIADSLWRYSVGWRSVKRVKKDTIIDLNHCDTTDLQYIRGIGPYTAKQIVRYREQLGGYYSPSQLADEVLDRYHLDTLLHHFTADPSDVQRLPVNTCSIDRLQRHPYMRYSQAKAIYTLRRKQVRLRSIDELSSLPDLSHSDLLRLAPYLSFE